MANKVNLGRLGFVIKGTAPPNTNFKRLDVVDDGAGNVYVSLKDQTLKNLSDLKPGSNWYRWIKSNDGSLEPVSNAISQGLIFCDTDDTEWYKNVTGKNGNQNIIGHKEVIIIPENISIGITARGFIVKLKHNCDFLCIDRNKNSDTNSTIINNVILPGDDVFMENDVWIFYISSMVEGTLNYTAIRIYREPKVISCEAFATCEYKTSPFDEKRLTIHPMGEIGKLKPNVTYQFRCHCVSAGIRLWNIVEMANGGNINTEKGFTHKDSYKLRFKIPVRIIPSYFDFMSDIKGDASKFIKGTYGELVYENGRADLGPEVEVRFPQLYDQKGYGKLNKLTIPIGESFTVILVPNYVFPNSTNNGGYESIKSSYWKLLIYFDNVDKIASVGNAENEQPGSLTPDPNPQPGSNLPSDNEWVEYDLNGDKKVDVEDVNMAIDILLRNNKRTNNRSLHNTKDSNNITLKYIPDRIWNQVLNENSTFDVEAVNKIINKILKVTTIDTDETEFPFDIVDSPEDPNVKTLGVKSRWNAEHLTIGDLDFSGRVFQNDYTIINLYVYQEGYYFSFEGNDVPFNENNAIWMRVSNKVDYYWREYMKNHNMTYHEFEEFVLNMPGTVNDYNRLTYANIIRSLISDLADINRDGEIDLFELNSMERYVDAVSNGETPPYSNIGRSLEVVMSEDDTVSQNNIAPSNSTIDGSIGFVETDAIMNKLDPVKYSNSNITIKQAIKRR